MSAEAGSISLLARDCRELFMKWERRLEKESRFTELDFVADYYDRFEAWAAFLGVFSGPLASLDHRLRRHPSIQDMVMRLLDILRHNLFDVYDAEATSLQVCEPSPGSPSSLPKLDMASIEGPIIKLNKLGIWIRSLSRSDATARARTLAKALNLDLRGFEETAYLALERLYPNCTESLRQQLANSMTDRYAKLQYEAYRKGALATKSPSHDDAQTPAPPGIQPPWTPAGGAARGPKEGKHVAFVDLPASSLATDAVNKKPFRMESEITPSSRSTAQTKSILDPGRAEPPMPVFEDGKHHAKCEWCFLTLDKNAFREKNGRRVAWSRKGREHYRQDLQPYVCVSAGCSQAFSLRTEWAEHMASSHRENWPHTIHSQPMWTCNRQHDFNAIYAFSTRGELDSHYRLLHSQDDANRNTTAQPEIRSLRSLNACPLCLYDLNEEDELSEKDTSQGESNMATPWKDFRLELMAEHVASHLETLMVLTLHLMSAIININGDEGSEGSVFSNVSDPDVSFVQPSWQGSAANTFEASSFAPASPTLSITSLVGSDIIAWNDLSIPPPANLDVEDTTAVDHMLQERAKEVNRTELVGDYSQNEEYDKINLSLGDELRLAFEKTSGKEPREFLPIEALDTIVTKDHVRTELLRLQTFDPSKVEDYVDQIWDPSEVKHAEKETSRRKIFAILALINQIDTVSSFIEEEIYDCDLPLVLLRDTKGGKNLCYPNSNGRNEVLLNPIKLFESWTSDLIKAFDRWQWSINVVVFSLVTYKDPELRHYRLPGQSILPFIEDDEIKKRRQLGGFGDVRRVKIHPAHHNHFDSDLDEDEGPPAKPMNPSFALKRLRVSDRKAFDLQVDSLKRSTDRHHLHLVELLGTYFWRDHYYLIFPWADANLLGFWQRFPEPLGPLREYGAVLWLSQQFLGLMDALKIIHASDVPHSDKSTQRSIPAYGDYYGGHGNLKPENILWFKDYDTGPNSGRFKISDFGLRHVELASSKMRANIVRTRKSPYRAPEYDVLNILSQKSDIWSLACVLLEFIGWFLYGYGQVDKFATDRIDDHNSEIKEDVFFKSEWFTGEDNQKLLGARAKRSVYDEFQRLFDNPHCSDYLVDLLDFIEMRLLRLNPKDRADCEEIVVKFKGLYDRCCKDENYCLDKVQKPPVYSRRDLENFFVGPVEELLLE